MIIAETDRLIIRHFNEDDTDYLVRQLNEPDFVRYIADKNVRTQRDALDYLHHGPFVSYETLGVGLNQVLLKETGLPIGMCGVLKRNELDLPDLGYAFLPEFCGQGLAFEAAKAVIAHSSAKGIRRLLAVTLPANKPSCRLLERLGFRYQRTLELYGRVNKLYGL